MKAIFSILENYRKNKIKNYCKNFDHLYNGILVIDIDGKIKYNNQSINKIFKYEDNEIYDQHIDLFIPNKYKHIHSKHLKYYIKENINKSNYEMAQDKDVIGSDKYQITIDLNIKLSSIKIGFKKYILVNIYNKINEKNLSQYEKFFNINRDMLAIVDLNGYFLKINPAFINKLGYSEEELYKKSFFEFIHSDDIEKTKVYIQDIKNGTIDTCINRYVTKNNEIILLSWNIVFENNIVYCVVSDISKKILVNNDILKYTRLLDQTEEIAKTGSWEWCVDTNDLFWTKGLKKIYGIEGQEVTYEKYMGINHPDDRDFIQNTINNSLVNNKNYEYIHRLICNNQVKYLFAKGTVEIKEGKKYITGVAQDISEQYKIESDLKDAKKKAEKASEMKSAFVANISHEIRTPINGIIGMTNILRDTKLDIEQTSFIDVISQSSGLLLSIINNVLDFSKIEAGKIDLEYLKIDLLSLLSSIKSSFDNIVNKNTTLTFNIDKSVPNTIITDPTKLRQIITNLLNNAIKFTEYGSVSLFVKCHNKNIYFEIKDTGVGISDDHIKNLFQPFIQADSSTTRNYGGTGLGLSICKNLINLLGGKINITSKLYIGTSVTFNLPIDSEAEYNYDSDNDHDVKSYRSYVSNENDENNKKFIVIVEDNKINQIVIKKTLEKLNYNNFVIYNNGKILIDNISNLKNISLIIMDLHMPLMDGYKCTKKIRELLYTTPIIALTANAMSGEKEKCIEIGMNDFILKPIQLQEFKNLLEKWL